MKDFKIVTAFLKEQGFIYPSSEIYGGLANSWDFAPLGILLKENIKQQWKEFFIYSKENSFLYDSPILLNNQVWKSSGHLKKFNDPVITCLNNNQIYRADQLINEKTNIKVKDLNNQELEQIIKDKVTLSEFGSDTKWGKVKNFNLMFKLITSKEKKDDESNFLYLRPETAQGIFIAFKNIIDTINPPLPFSIGQIGKAFRNEVTPGNYIFKTKEFEQLEIEHFVEEKSEEITFEENKKSVLEFLKKLGIDQQKILIKTVNKEELAHYSKKTIDFEYRFPFGEKEFLGISNRGNYDLKNHQKSSNQSFNYLNHKSKEKILPSIIEISIGIERLFLVLILEHLHFINNDQKARLILKLPYDLAPYKLAVAPLTNKLNQQAKALYQKLLKDKIGPIIFTSSGSIGKRYYRQDAIGTPFVITYDFDSPNDQMVTIRNRDDQKQQRIKINQINKFLKTYAK